jgi:uncharacterized protein GlcG (DUF336 family)
MIILAQAVAVIDGALAEARNRGAAPLGVVVLDAGGAIVAFKREDRATLFRFDIARAKAHGALGMGADTSVLAKRAANNLAFFTSVAVATGGDLALSPGGVLIRDARGEVIGAVGVSGDTGEVDELCAFAGMASAGLLHGGTHETS